MADGLPWFRADTNLPTNDKVLELAGERGGKAALFVYICSLAYAVGHGTDGLIKKAALPFVHGTPAEARLLVDHRFWVLVDGGWQIKNFGTRQMIAAEAQAIQAEASEKGRRMADARWKGDAKPHA